MNWELLFWIALAGLILAGNAIIYYELGMRDGYRRGYRHGRSHVKAEW